MAKCLILLFLIPSAIGFYVSYNAGHLYPPLSNIDYIILLVFLIYLSRVRNFPCATFALMGVISIISVQMISAIGGLFVSDIGALIDYFGFVQEWPWGVYVPFIVGGAVIIGLYYFLLKTIDFRSIPLWAPLLLLGTTLALDVLGAASPLKLKYNVLEANVATSSAVELYGLSPRILHPVAWAPTPVNAPLKEIILKSPMPARALSVAIESWGVFQEDELNSRILENFEQLVGSSYQIHSQNRGSRSGTINGEFRELCGLTILSMPSAQEAYSVREHCLPAILASKGWDTHGLHGNSGLFYDRRRIYPAIGLENVRFREDFDRVETSPCRSVGFTGWCDPVVLRQGMTQLAASARSFVHVMTLDTHLPLRPVKGEVLNCGNTNEDVCLYVHRFRHTLDNIAKAINEAPVKPDMVFIWGDHPPPFIHKETRDQFIPNQVPMLILTLKRAEAS